MPSQARLGGPTGARLRWVAGLLALVRVFCCGDAAAADRVTLQLSDVRQAQFAGYYVAEEKGFYAAAGLDVTIRAGAANGDSAAPVAGADVWSAWLPAALAARAQGLALVNIAQVFAHSGLSLVCRKSAGVHSPADFKGHTATVWPDESRIVFAAWMRKLGLTIPGDVAMQTVTRASGAADVAPLLNRDAACVTALNYDQYWRAIEAGLAPGELQVFHYGDAGFAILQDGLYVTEASLADAAQRERLVRFVRASMQGWDYAVAHQAEAVAIVLQGGPPPSPAEMLRQTRMMSSVARLTESTLEPIGYLEPAAFDRSVQLLLDAGPGGPIAQRPVGAWSHAIWEQARKRP